MKAHKLILTALVVILIASCSSTKRTLKRQDKCAKWGVCKPAKDSTVYIEKIVIDSFPIEASEIWMSMLFECDSSGALLIRQIDSLSSINANLQMSMKDNRLIVFGEVPARVLRIPKLMTSLNRTVVQERFTNVLTTGQSFWIVMGKIFAVSILLTLIVGLLWLRFKRK